MYLKIGDKVNSFYKANAAIGNVIFRFNSFAEMQEKINIIQHHCYPEFEGIEKQPLIVNSHKNNEDLRTFLGM